MEKTVEIQLEVISFLPLSITLFLSSSRFILLSHTPASPLNEKTKLNLHLSNVTVSDMELLLV
jgi:hypothetical protein